MLLTLNRIGVLWLLSLILIQSSNAFPIVHNVRFINKTEQDITLTYKKCLYEKNKNGSELKGCDNKKVVLNPVSTGFYLDENLDFDWEKTTLKRFRVIVNTKAQLNNNSTTIFINNLNGINDEDVMDGDFVTKSCWNNTPGYNFVFTKYINDDRIHCLIL